MALHMKKYLIIYLLIINLFSCFLYYVDKKRAIKNHYRISERNLLIVGLIGGAYGCLIGMKMFHHKTKHGKFVLLIPTFCIIWTIILLYQLTTI